jgi:hypothetical protein
MDANISIFRYYGKYFFLSESLLTNPVQKMRLLLNKLRRESFRHYCQL